MNKGVFAIVFCVVTCFAACSSSGPDVSTTANGSPTNTTGAGGDANAANGVLPIANSNEANGDRVGYAQHRRIPPPNLNPGPPATPQFRPGPENSEMATTMNADGQPVEVRVFKDHPQLAKVEATWLGPKQKLLRITLRSGSTVELTTDQIADLSSASSELLVQLCGASK